MEVIFALYLLFKIAFIAFLCGLIFDLRKYLNKLDNK